MKSSPLRIIDAVFRDPNPEPKAPPWLKTWFKRSLYLAVALGLHVSAVFSLWIIQTPPPAPTPKKPAPIEVALAPTPPPKKPQKPPEPPPIPQPEPNIEPPVQPPPVAAVQPPPVEPPAQPPPKPKPLAKAGRAITRDPKPSEPLDLSDPGLTVGDANAYAGGVTSPHGTSDTAVAEAPFVPFVPPAKPDASPPPEPAPPKPPKHVHDLTRPVALEGGRWNCPWPAEADREEIDSQLVIIRVTVGPDGAPLSARVTRDPGFGFGPAAQACAMSRHYAPAQDAEGQPTTAESPPIRVHFSRW